MAQTSTQASAQALHTSLSQLQIAQDTQLATPTIKVKKSSAAPVDSWEDEADADEDDDSDSDSDESEHTPIASPGPPPPTPSSPSQTSLPLADASPYQTYPPFGLGGSDGESSPTRAPRRAQGEGEVGEKRPEKSTAVASRLIAAGIGQKAPKRSKEQREYDSAVKMQERKKRETEREEEERKVREREKARRDIWEG